MKIVLECSKSNAIIIKHTLNQYFTDLKYVDISMLTHSSLLIIEISSLDNLHFFNTIKESIQSDTAFIISKGDYMFELLEAQPLVFLRQTHLQNDLNQLIKHLEVKRKGLDMMIEFKSAYQTIRLNIENIVYIESFSHYLYIHTQNADFKVREKLSDTIKRLQPFVFIQVHKSYLINKHYISQKNTYNILLCQDIHIPIGNKYKDNLM